jgi:uncharacterized protein YqjF (DUF2071 family)
MAAVSLASVIAGTDWNAAYAHVGGPEAIGLTFTRHPRPMASSLEGHVTDHDFNRAILNEVAHRPWPMPDGPWVMTQTWHDLLFAHWPIDAGALREHVPSEFDLDLFDGTAWLAIVPFHMTNVAPRGVPSLPWISEFPELNVRTYVRVSERPGIYFFSLDAGSTLAVQAAKSLLNLPYYSAAMHVAPNAGSIEYDSRREHGSTAASLSARYRPVGAPFKAISGSLEYFLTERYCLYNLDHRDRPYRLDIHHPPWSLQLADAEFTRNTMGDAAGLFLPQVKPLLHFARRQDMVAWTPTPL